MPFRIGLSGLNAAQADLKVTGNNIANVGTVGFKQSRAEFSDVYATSKGGSVSTAIGSGVRLANTAQQFTQGNLVFTENNLDLAITGDGFFSLRDTAGNSIYTRNGQFKTDGDGFVVDNSGSRLQAYGTDAATNEINTGSVSDLKVVATNIPPQPTSSSAIVANIDSRSEILTPAWNMDIQGTVAPSSYNHTTSFTTFDSLGNEMQTALYFRKTGTGEWEVGIKQVDANGNIFQNFDVNAVQDGPPQIIFNPTSSGGATTVSDAAFAADNTLTDIEITSIRSAYTDAYDAYLVANPATPHPYSLANDAGIAAAESLPFVPAIAIDTITEAQLASVSPEKVTFFNNGLIDPASVGSGLGLIENTINLSDPSIINPVMTTTGGTLQSQPISIDVNKLSQYGASFGITNLTQNGYATGQLSGIEIDPSGIVLARFTNGQASNLGQIYLTNFTNNQGLSQIGNNYWGESISSGQGVVNIPGQGNAGLINSGANEDSNVDLTAQLISLITAQRNFQANAKTITTANQVTQTLLQI